MTSRSWFKKDTGRLSNLAFTYTINNHFAVLQTIEINDPRAAAFAHAGARPSDFTTSAGARNDIARVRVGCQPVDERDTLGIGPDLGCRTHENVRFDDGVHWTRIRHCRIVGNI
jgi:hypothetical protein